MLGLIQGRVYYNLLNWYRLVSLMPGFSYNRKFMEQMMGLHVVKDFSINDRPQGFFERNVLQLARLLTVGFRMAWAHCRLQKDVRRFHRHFARMYGQYSALDYQSLSPLGLRQLYQEFEDTILWNWKAPITNDFEAMIFYGLLKNFTLKWGLDPNGTLQNDLSMRRGRDQKHGSDCPAVRALPHDQR